MPNEADSVADYRFYEPQYFKFSETYRTWVKLFISDCFLLKQLEGFESTRARFWKNHPIRWIQLVGIVTGVIVRAAHAEIELDDGSGACLNLYIKGSVAETIQVDFEHNTCAIDVGHLIRVKGTLANDFKSELQMVVDKMERLHEFSLELTAWQERVVYKKQVLNVPWQCAIQQYKPEVSKGSSNSIATAHDKALVSYRADLRHRKKESAKQDTMIDLPSLDAPQHTQRNLKIVFLQYFKLKNLRRFSLRQLRTSEQLDAATICVTRHSIASKHNVAGILDEDESELHVTSSQKYRTMNACLTELVRDGSIVPIDIEKGTFEVVGKWNLGRLMQSLMQDMFGSDLQRSEVTVREMWQAVRQADCGFASISKQMVQKVLVEMQADAQVLVNEQLVK